MSGIITLLDQPRTLDALGRPTSAVIDFFLAGTTTRATIYSDEALTTPAANPVLLSSGQIFPDIYLDGEVVYRRRITYGDGTIHDVDPFNIGAILAENISFLQSGTGAAIRSTQSKLRDVISVKDFGAVGNNVADDTVAIQAAINAAVAARKALYFPSHNPGAAYKITSTLSITGPLNVYGEHPDSCTLFATGMLANTYIVDVNLAAGTNNYFGFTNITIRANNFLPDGMRLKNVSYLLMENVQFYNTRDAYSLEGTICFSNTFRNVTGYQMTRYTAYFKAYTGGGNFSFDACTFAGDVGFFVDNTSSVSQITVTGSNFEQCTTNSIRVEGSVKGFAINGARTEGCNGNDFVFIPDTGHIVAGLSITGSYFTSDAAASFPIVLGGDSGAIRGFSIMGNWAEIATVNFVFLNGEGESGVIAGNRFGTATCTPTNTTRAGVVVYSNENTAGKCAEFWGTAVWGVTDGNWTPIDSSGAGLTFGTAVGRYTKIGRVVNWQMFVSYPVTASGASAVIGGLPIAVSAGVSTVGRSGAVLNATNAAIDVGILQGITSATALDFYNRINAGTPITNVNLSGKYIYASGQYMTA
jgi:Pectate lyase superfamily protein